MQHARQDYNERIIDTSGKIPEGEPVMLFRGTDKHTAAVVRFYADLVERDINVHPDFVACVRRHAFRIDDYAKIYGKSPDAPPQCLL